MDYLKNKKILKTCLVLVLSIGIGVYSWLNLPDSAPFLQSSAVGDLEALSGLSSNTLNKIYNVVGEEEQLRENIFVYKYIMNEH